MSGTVSLSPFEWASWRALPTVREYLPGQWRWSLLTCFALTGTCRLRTPITSLSRPCDRRVATHTHFCYRALLKFADK